MSFLKATSNPPSRGRHVALSHVIPLTRGIQVALQVALDGFEVALSGIHVAFMWHRTSFFLQPQSGSPNPPESE